MPAGRIRVGPEVEQSALNSGGKLLHCGFLRQNPFTIESLDGTEMSRIMGSGGALPAPYWEQARLELAAADPVLGKIIELAGHAVLRPRHDPFFSLSRSIVGQQISVKAAESVWKKMLASLGEITPDAIARETEDSLRECGLSRPKARYLLSLAAHFIDGSLQQEQWRDMDDEAVIERLVQVKGIGRWTAEMFLIFHLLRPDVLPVDDIGIQRAMANHYTTGARPNANQMRTIAVPWHPWRSVASWYLWRSLDAIPVEY